MPLLVALQFTSFAPTAVWCCPSTIAAFPPAPTQNATAGTHCAHDSAIVKYSLQRLHLPHFKLQGCTCNCDCCSAAAATDDTGHVLQHAMGAVCKLKIVHVDAL